MTTIAAGGGESDDDAGARRLVMALGVAQICSWGSLFYSFPLVAEAMRPELGWSKPQIYGAASCGLVLAGLCALPVGAAIDRGRGRLVMATASILAGLLFVVWSTVTDIVLFYVVLAALGCLQAATLYEPGFAVIARRVGPERARRGIVTLTLWGGFASTVFIPVTQTLIDTLGWRSALIVLGAINIAVCGSLHLLAIDPSKDMPRPAPVRAGGGRGALGVALRRPVFWALALSLVCYAAAFSALTFHLYPMLIERGLGAAEVVAVMAVIGPSQVAGRMIVWTFARNAPIRTIGSVVMAVFPLAVTALILAPPNAVLIGIIAVFYGAANGITTIVRGLSVPEMVSRDGYGAINGALVTPMNLTQAGAPLAAAWIWSASGGYDAVLLAILGGSILLVLSFWAAAMLSKPGRR